MRRRKRAFRSLCFDVFVVRCDFIYTGVQEKWLNDLQMNKYLHINYSTEWRKKNTSCNHLWISLRLLVPAREKRAKEIAWRLLLYARFRQKVPRKWRGQKWRERNRTLKWNQWAIRSINYMNTLFGMSCTRSIDGTRKRASQPASDWTTQRKGKKKQHNSVQWKENANSKVMQSIGMAFNKRNGNWRILKQQLHFFCSQSFFSAADFAIDVFFDCFSSFFCKSFGQHFSILIYWLKWNEQQLPCPLTQRLSDFDLMITWTTDLI